MTEAKHTPGPWTVDATHDEDWSCYHEEAGTSCAKQIHADGRVVAFAAYHTPKLFGTKKEDAELQANARLIAAAPELLEAVKKRAENEEQRIFEDWLSRESPSGDHDEVNRQWLYSSDYIDFCDEWSEELDAIAKATGK